MRDYSIPEESIREFGVRVARAMNELRSSHCFFILQQAYPENADDWSWDDFQELLNKVLEAK